MKKMITAIALSLASILTTTSAQSMSAQGSCAADASIYAPSNADYARFTVRSSSPNALVTIGYTIYLRTFRGETRSFYREQQVSMAGESTRSFLVSTERSSGQSVSIYRESVSCSTW